MQEVTSYHPLSRKVQLALSSCRHAEATTLLLAVIREAPNLPDAYHTLGLLYESQGDAKKALDFHMISAHLSKVSRWSTYELQPKRNTLVSCAAHVHSVLLFAGQPGLETYCQDVY